jgi:hypothetical protein
MVTTSPTNGGAGSLTQLEGRASTKTLAEILAAEEKQDNHSLQPTRNTRCANSTVSSRAADLYVTLFRSVILRVDHGLPTRTQDVTQTRLVYAVPFRIQHAPGFSTP